MGGDLQALWRFLDRNSSEMVTLIELAAFKKWATDSFGEDIDDVLSSLGFSDCKEVAPKDFSAAVKRKGFDGGLKTLQELIQHGEHMMLEDIQMLDRWQPPMYITSEPDHQELESWK